MRVNDFLHYLTHEKRCSPHTIQSYTTDLQQFSFFLQNEFQINSAKEIHFQFIRNWIAFLLNNNISARSVNRKITTLNTYFRYLIKEEVIKQNPMQKIIAPKMSKRLPVFVEEQKMQFLFDDLMFADDFEGKRDRLILELFYLTGMRLSELINLQHSHLDEYNATVLVLGKRNKERLLPITQDVLQKINELKNILPAEYLFVSKNGAKMKSKQIYQIVKRYLAKVSSLDKKSPHVLRHTFATHLLNNGADIIAIKELLGHANLSATQVYTHNTIEKVKKVYKQAHPRA